MMRRTTTLFLTICAAALVASTAVVAGEEPAVAKLGEPVPDFTLVDAVGVKRSLSDYKGKLVVLEWINPQCPFVQGCYKTKAMQKAYEKVKALDKGVVWLAINTTWSTSQEGSGGTSWSTRSCSISTATWAASTMRARRPTCTSSTRKAPSATTGRSTTTSS
jgi:hypothetical protein